ncbi:MAG: transposase [Pirellulaceae bacterium]
MWGTRPSGWVCGLPGVGLPAVGQPQATMLLAFSEQQVEGSIAHIRELCIEDHVQRLLSLRSTISVAKAIQLINGGASKWIHDTFPEHRDFSWQERYGAFSMINFDPRDAVD